VRRGLLALVAVSVAAGCGQTSSTPPARARTIELDWHEGGGLEVDVRRIVTRTNGWSVSARVRNGSRVSLLIERPHHPGHTEFGVLALGSPDADAVEAAGPGVFASRFEPALPRTLGPDDEWSGTFSGPGRLSNAHYVRIELGRFTNLGARRGGLPRRFRYVTDHVARLR
jgi:hypothetical protein